MKALWINENDDNTFSQQIIERSIDELPAGEVLIRVKYSSLNYKDALSSTGNRGVTKKYPHTPGIDAAGIVENAENEDFTKGDKVIVTGFDLGMNTSGGFGEYIRVPTKWVIKLPKGLKLKESMMFGTGGLTAALCIDKIISNGITPQKGKIIVTGSTGGVGIMAVMILSKIGFEVVAVTGKPEAKDFLMKIGAKEVIGRNEIDDKSNRPLLKGQFAGAVDTVGGNLLATILKSMNYGGVVSVCGLVNSPELPTSVFPFILRGVSMFGIDSAECDIEWRKKMWKNLAKKWKPEQLNSVIKTVTLQGLPKEIKKILKGGQIGRVVVRL
ncbi:MAG: YhdH/YhfP family quinone oxidoreductase [Spirosomataceae bacterium]